MTFCQSVALAMLASTIAAGSQLVMKAGANRSRGRHLAKLWINRGVILGYLGLFVTTILNVVAFKVLPLKTGVCLQPLSLLLVVAGSRLIFHEKLSRTTLVALGLILAGMIVFNLPF